MIKSTNVVGVHDFDWLYAHADDEKSRGLVDRIVQIEKSYMEGKPLTTGTRLLKLKLDKNTVWTRENTTHSIPYGYVQIFKLLDEILPAEFRQPMDNLIVDVGANEGHWSLYMGFGHPRASIIAIEPNPVPLELMRKNFESNGLNRIKVLPIAMNDTSGTAELETLANVTSLGSFQIDRNGRPWITDDEIRKITVPCKDWTICLRFRPPLR